MYTHETRTRVRYSETDQMGVVYYGHYAQYFEVGRAEAIRALGYTYRELEATGVLMPVIELRVRYLRPVRYDDLILIRTTVRDLPRKVITFHSDIFGETGEHLTTGLVTLAFVDSSSGRTCRPPASLTDRLESFFS